MTVRILQVGVGTRGRHWVQFIKDHPDCATAAMVDDSHEALAAANGILGDGAGCPTFETLDKALASAEADAALIASPSALHADQAIACLEAGLTVMVEKPFGTSVAEAQRVLDRASALGKQVIVAENYRYWPAERTIMKLLKEGFLGRIDHASMTDRRHQPSHTEGPWMATMEFPQLEEIAIHHFDSLRGFFGQPTTISVRTWNPPWTDYAHGANTEALIAFGDVRVQYLGTMLSHRYGFSFWVEGEKGVLWTNRKYVAFRPGGSRLFRPVRNVKVPPGDEAKYPKGGTTSLLNSLRDAVTTGASAETRGEDNIWTVAMVETGKESDRQQRTLPIEVPWPRGGAA